MTREEAIEALSLLKVFDAPRLSEAIEMAVTALRTHPDAQPNEPLTLEEMRGMEGQPVWVERHDSGPSGYAIVGDFMSLYGVYFGTAKGGLRLYYDEYGKTWVAYRRPLKEDRNDR